MRDRGCRYIFVFYFGFELLPMFTLLLLMHKGLSRAPAVSGAGPRRALHDVIAEAQARGGYGSGGGPGALRSAPSEDLFLHPDMSDEAGVLNAWVDDTGPGAAPAR